MGAHFMIGRWLPKEESNNEELLSEQQQQQRNEEEEHYSLYDHYHRVQQEKQQQQQQGLSSSPPESSISHQQEEKESSNDNICSICNESMLIPVLPSYTLRPTVELYCGHKFCLSCITGYGNGSSSTNQDITCPTCHKPLCLD